MLLIMSTPNPRSTGGHTYPLSAQQMEQRAASPAEFPMLHGDRLLSANVRLPHAVLHHISGDAER